MRTGDWGMNVMRVCVDGDWRLRGCMCMRSDWGKRIDQNGRMGTVRLGDATWAGVCGHFIVRPL
jgi:hypothetical protein